MSGADQIFGAFNSAQARELAEQQRQHSFEEWAVKALLRYARVPFHVGRAKAEAQLQFNSSVLGFLWFDSAYPGFPVQLAASKLSHTASPRWTALFGSNFAKLPWFKEYQNCAAAYGWNLHRDRCALIFNAPHADKAATMVFHNQPIQEITIVEDPERRTEPETRIIRPYGRPQVVYVIESFSSFMATVGTSWAEDLCQSHS